MVTKREARNKKINNIARAKATAASKTEESMRA
jgi:hypothetical protein